MEYLELIDKHLSGKTTRKEKDYLLDKSLKIINEFVESIRKAEYVKKVKK